MSCPYPLYRLDYFRFENCLNLLLGSFAARDLRSRVRNKSVFLKKSELDCFPSDFLEKYIQKIPCGRCMSCRLKYSRDWALRLMLEAEKYEHNYFLTLTYDTDHLPVRDILYPDTGEILFDEPVLDKPIVSTFMKRLRTYLFREFGFVGVRFFACGEYGDLTGRPHYHIILLNCPDLSPYDVFYKRENGFTYYNNSVFSRCWVDKNSDPLGFCVSGDVTWDTCAYVARYILKKQVGKSFERELNLMVEYPEFKPKDREFVLMSRRPGIACDVYDERRDEFYSYDKVVAKFGDRLYITKPPRYFDKKFDVDEPELFEQLKINRSEFGLLSNREKLSHTSLSDSDLAIQSNRRLERLKRARDFE